MTNPPPYDRPSDPPPPTAAQRSTEQPPPPASLGPGSPHDVPPVPGEHPIDPATLPDAIRDELLAPDPPVLDTSSAELRDGLNRCPTCGSTDVQLRPSTGMLVCLFC